MYQLTILAVGKLKEPFWRDAIAEYEKRLSPFAKVRLIEVADGKSVKDEGDALRKRLPKGAFIIPLAKEGRAFDSEGFAEFLRREGEGGREMVFVIGGPFGLDEHLVGEGHQPLSLSKLTFTHGEARAILFEQLYRAMTILAGKTYHY